MQELLELIKIVNPTKLKNIQIVGKGDTKTDSLYWLLQKGKISTDEEAMKHLYPETKSKGGLYQVKEKLLNKLLDSSLIVDTPYSKNSSYTIARYNCLNYCAAFERASFNGVRKLVIKLGEKILKIALAYNMCDIIVRVSGVLTRKAVFILRDIKKVRYYRGLYVKYSELMQLEELSTYYWLEISFHTSQKRMVEGGVLVDQAQTYIDELESKLLPDHTANTFANILSLKIRIEELNNNHEKVVDLVDEYLDKLEGYNDVRTNYFTVGLNRKLSALTTLRRFEEAEAVANLALNLAREGMPSWFTALENLIILYFYQAKYAEAFEVFQTASTNRVLKAFPKSRQEIFKVYRAYLQFFINTDLLSTDKVGSEYKAYRSAKFSNEVPIFSKDKIGINITIQIAEFLLLFTEGNYKKAKAKVESLRQYANSHLRKGVTFRSNCFMKMLIKLIECNFQKSETMRKTKSLYAKLVNQPDEEHRQTSHVEIVPYEVLWGIILEHIDDETKLKFKAKSKVTPKS